jgi:hypothetical protein
MSWLRKASWDLHSDPQLSCTSERLELHDCQKEMSRNPRWPGAGYYHRLILVSALAVSAAYMVRRPMEIPLGSSVLGALCTDNFHDAEGNYRWTKERSTLIFPDPGPGVDVVIELLVTGFRPPGQTPPMVVIEAGDGSLRARPGRGETLTLETRTRGWWSSNLEVRFRSETYSPSDLDRRALGIRVHRARLVPEGSPFGLGRPPLRQPVTVTLGLAFLLLLLAHRGQPTRKVRWAGYILALLWGLGFAFARPYAALASLPFFIATGLAFGASVLFPSVPSVLNETFKTSIDAFRVGLRTLTAWPTVGFLLIGTIGITATYLTRPRFEIDLGTGRETTLLEQFGSYDQEQGVKFRRALRGARIDLGDFGGGSSWTVAITASLAGRNQDLILARVGEVQIRANLGPEWSTHELNLRVPVGWRPGPIIELASASEAIDLRVDELQIARGRSLPSIHVIACVLGTALLVVIGLVGSGLSARVGWITAGAVLVVQLTALLRDPLLAVPFVGTFFIATAGGVGLMILFSGALTALARRDITPSPVPAALAASGLGFAAWLSATLFPLYQGGHFVFHSSIAEEIWQGKFLTYYLPYPGSMLSRQPQWGNLIVPHSNLYHTLVSPLAALPRDWFYGLEKAVLALMLTITAVVASLVATRVSSARAGAYAGMFAACLPTTFQLLGLGHLMTLFGVFASTLALGFLTLHFDRLTERAIWWWTFLLLTLCFLSYTASLLLTVTALVLALPFLYRQSPTASRALVGAALAASAAAFVLYYINWTLPFLRDSLPVLLSGMGNSEQSPYWSRVVAIPQKLTYTFGSAFLPLIGLAGLALARPSNQRTLLASWGGTLVLFSAADLFFNFLLKHHYFVIPAVSIGLGLSSAWLSQKGFWGRAAAATLVMFTLVLGARAALGVALG